MWYNQRMPLDVNHRNYLPANEDRNYILDPSATGVDDNGNIRPLDFISDLSVSCGLDDEIYLSNINIGKELISGILMADGQPVLTFTVLKKDWNYGKPVFLNSLADGYNGWITPGRLNIVNLPIVYSYSAPEQSRIAERCLFRLQREITSVAAAGSNLTGLITLEGVNGLTLESDGNQIIFNIDDAAKKSCANGINYFSQYHEEPFHNVGSIGNVFPDENGELAIIFDGPFTLTAVKDENGEIIGAGIGIDVELNDLCLNKKTELPDILDSSLDCEVSAPYTPSYSPESP